MHLVLLATLIITSHVLLYLQYIERRWPWAYKMLFLNACSVGGHDAFTVATRQLSARCSLSFLSPLLFWGGTWARRGEANDSVVSVVLYTSSLPPPPLSYPHILTSPTLHVPRASPS